MATTRRYDSADLHMTIAPWSDEVVRLGAFEVPQWFDVKLEHPEWPTAAVLSISVGPDGPVVSGLRAERTSATTTYRDVADLLAATAPMDVLLQQATALAVGIRAASAFRAQKSSDPDFPPQRLRGVEVAIRDAAAAQAWEAARPQRRRTLTRDLLRQVAEVYRQAHAAGDPPTVAVAEQFKVSHRTATRWVGEARKAKELGPALGRQPGEAATAEGKGGEADGGPDQAG
jgi:hypothetical protein